MQVGIGDIAQSLLHFATWLKYVVTSHHARSTEGTPTPVKNDASWPQEQLWTLCCTWECIPSAGNWNTIRLSASPHLTPSAGVNKLPAIPNIPLVQAGLRCRPCGICGEHSNNQRGVSLSTYFFSISIIPPTVRACISFFHLSHHKI